MGQLVEPRVRRAAVAICLASPWLHCQGSPRLIELHRMLPTTASIVRQAVLGDVDGDGARDLVLYAGARNSVCRSVGGGRFEIVPNALPPLPLFARLTLADLDGDGDRDCAVAVPANCDNQSSNCSGGANLVLWNDGTGRFGAPGPALPADPAVISLAVAAGDVDGDGDVDLVFGCTPHVWTDVNYPFPPNIHSVRGENWLFLNDGTGNFAAANSRLGADRDATNAVLLEDFDGDGDRDLFAANANTPGGSAQDAYYRNDGLGNFTRIAGALPVDGDDARDAQTLDVDNDGDRDVLLLTAQGLRLLRNNGLGAFTDASSNVTAPAGTVDQVFLGDCDGDGDVDIGLRSGGTVRQLRNDGTGLFAHVPAADRTGDAGTALVGDFDADGDLDLALLRGGYLDHSLWLNDGSGAWSRVPDEMPLTLANQFAPVAVDIDNDGDLDVVACAENAVNTVYRNDGSGRFSVASYGDFSTDVFLGEACAAGDLDGDGYADVAVANAVLPFFGIVPSQIYHNDGAGRLDRVPLPAVDAMSVALGDLDRDGDLDVYFGCTGVDVVLRNQDNMTFVPIAGAVTDALPTKSVALGDVDFDGDLDAVLVGWFGTAQRVLRNDGTGVFTALPGALPIHLDDSQHVLLADIDRDADLDIVVANDGGAAPQPNRCYRNNGFGVFTESGQDLPPGNGRTISLTAADFDGDGDLDLIETAFVSPVPTRLLENDGQGHFTVVAGGLPEVRDYAHEFAAGDFDRDGDLDAFLIAQGQPNLYWNLRRQVCWRDLPRLGRTLTIELFGAPGDPFLLGCSPNRIDVPWPGFGQLQIDPATLLRLEFGTLDAQGRGARAFAVPNVPALLDQTFYWQAMLGSSGRLTNLELTTLRRP